MKDEKQPAVYILANGPRGTIYVGVTAALWSRVATHKDGSVKGFSSRYAVKSLVWYEHHATMDSAIKREKQIKKWNRDWKVNMIERFNPSWVGLHDSIDLAVQFDEAKLDSRLRGNDGGVRGNDGGVGGNDEGADLNDRKSGHA
jgi:putative endonuclease